MNPIHVFFLRGLTTHGQDSAKWSAFNFGLICKNLVRALGERQVILHPILGMGAGPLLTMTERARAFLNGHAVWQDPALRVHVLGHSAGGLVARLLAESFPPAKVLSLVTIAAPNRGSALARICIEMPKKHPGTTRLLRTLGYDIATKRHLFEELLPESVEKLLPLDHTRPLPTSLRTASLVCSMSPQEFCRPLKLMYKLRALRDFDLPSDGFVERDTQSFGDVIAELKIDHFGQIGLFGEAGRFAQMCDLLAEFYRKTS